MTRLSEEYSAAAGGKNLFTQPQQKLQPHSGFSRTSASLMLSASIGTCFLVHYKETVLTLFYQITFAQMLLQWSIEPPDCTSVFALTHDRQWVC
jgi:hypothetical protein